MELTKSDLLKLVTYFEGEIQARDIAIAALKVTKRLFKFYPRLMMNCVLLVGKTETSGKCGQIQAGCYGRSLHCIAAGQHSRRFQRKAAV